MAASAVLFYNPNSGRFSAQNIDAWLTEFTANGLEITTISNPEELRGLSPTHIIVAGGDGSLHVAVNHAGLEHSFSILPVGSGNDFAANFKRLSIEELSQKITAGEVMDCNIFCVNGIYAHNVCGTGFESFVAARAKKIKLPALKYIIPIARYMFFYKPIDAIITADNVIYEGKIFLVTLGNGKYSGGGFRMFPKASLSDGKMDMIIIKPHNILQRLLYVFLVNFGLHTQLKPVVFRQLSSCKIALKEKHAFQADGDLYSADLIEVEVRKGFRVVGRGSF
jgi:diacylglycerol kinase family enzyme